jgi:hypothetical protein
VNLDIETLDLLVEGGEGDVKLLGGVSHSNVKAVRACECGSDRR